MTRDDILKLAREADSGFDGGPDADGTMADCLVGIESIERFARLVAASESEACAKICDVVARVMTRKIDDTIGAATYCAAAIRARSVGET